MRDINFRGAKLAGNAREIVGLPVFIAGSVGPFGAMRADGSEYTGDYGDDGL